MKIVKKYELIQPKTGETNRLFGVRYLNRHKMRDKRWTAADKMLQYSGLTRLYGGTCFTKVDSKYNFLSFIIYLERDHALKSITEASERKEQLIQVKDLKKELKDKNQLLRLAIKGDAQRIKNLIQHDKHMRRAYPRWDSYVAQ